MAREQAEAFIAKMKTDEAFHARVMALKDVATPQQLIDDEGFDCTVEEIAAAGVAPAGEGRASDLQDAAVPHAVAGVTAPGRDAADGLTDDALTWVPGRLAEPVEDELFLPG